MKRFSSSPKEEHQASLKTSLGLCYHSGQKRTSSPKYSLYRYHTKPARTRWTTKRVWVVTTVQYTDRATTGFLICVSTAIICLCCWAFVWNPHHNGSGKNYLTCAKARSLSSRSLVRLAFSALNLSISASSSASLSLRTRDGTVFPAKEQPDASHLSCNHKAEDDNYKQQLQQKIKNIKWYYLRDSSSTAKNFY